VRNDRLLTRPAKQYSWAADETFTREAEAYLSTDNEVLKAYRDGIMPLRDACALVADRRRADRLGIRRPPVYWSQAHSPNVGGRVIDQRNPVTWSAHTWKEWSNDHKDHDYVEACKDQGAQDWHKHRAYLEILESCPITDTEREAQRKAQGQSGAFPRREAWQQWSTAHRGGNGFLQRATGVDGCCFRAVNQDLGLKADGRTLAGMLAPYNEVARVDDGAGPYWETFEPGCFDACLRRDPSHLRVQLEHDGHWVGRGHMWRDGPAGLSADMRLDATEAGREAAYKIRDRQTPGLSLAFMPGANSRTVRHKDGRDVVHRIGIRAVHHVALCQQGAYASAQVTAVRQRT
jgi:HK97 family phage prohead protease